jgi:hypothetical protein
MDVGKQETKIIDAHYEGDNLVVKQAEYVAPAQWDAYCDREYGNNGWTEGKNFRKIATIPASILHEHPEFQYDRRALNHWLQNAGAPYSSVKKGW